MYNGMAGFYDRLTADIDYKEYSDYFISIFKRHMKKEPSSIVDLGCGTGNLTVLLDENGYEMTGVDSSAAMLSIAYTKSRDNILWINQDITELDLFGTYDAAVSVLDCVNHIMEEVLLEKYFKLVFNFLNPGGAFVFDINTEYKFREIYGLNVFYAVNDEFAYIWQNNYDEAKKTCTMDITFFEKENDRYRRSDAINMEKAYGVSFIKKTLQIAGFKVEGIYDNLTFDNPSDNSERIFFMCKKEG